MRDFRADLSVRRDEVSKHYGAVSRCWFCRGMSGALGERAGFYK